MKKNSTIFARLVLYLVGIAALAVCVILLPELAREESAGKSDVTIPFLTVSYILATPFFVALYQSHKLLNYIDRNKAFSAESIRALKNIKICAIVFGVLIVLGVITLLSVARIVNPKEDVTGFATLGFIFTFISSVIAVFVAVLQRLLADAVIMKSENDLIV